MKKTISLLLVAMLLVAVMAPTAFAAEAGETVTVALFASGDDFANFDGSLTYDHDKLTLVSLTGSNCGNFLAGTNNPDNFVWSRTDNVSNGTQVMTATFTLKVAIPCGEPIKVGASISWCGNQNGERANISVGGSTNYHVKGETKTEEHIKGDCVTDSCVDTVVYCSLCGLEMSRTHTTTPAPGHIAGEAVTENVVGATCTVAGSYDEVTYCTVCGCELNRKSVTGSVLPHTPGAAVKENVVAADCVNDGSYESVVYCTACGFEISRETVKDPAKGHKPGDPVRENVVAATCGQAGSYDEVVYCTVCGCELSRDTVTVPVTGGHNHVWTDNKDGKTHTGECTCGDKIVENHTYGPNGKTCTKCGYTKPDDNTEPTKPGAGGDMGDITPYPAFVLMAVAAIMGTAYGFKRFTK